MSCCDNIKLNNQLFVGFDRNGNYVVKNDNFNKYFSDISNVEDLRNKEFYDIGKYSPNTFIMKSDYNSILYKFDVIQNEKYMFCVGEILDEKHLFSSIDTRNKVHDKILSDEDLRDSKKLYCTLILDCSYRVSFYSENVKDVLSINSPYGLRIDDILGKEFLDKVREKIGYLDFVDDLSIEFEDKMVIVSRIECGFLSVNIYPYSPDKNDRLEEIYSLYAKIDQLKNELQQKEDMIKIQKEIINDLSCKIAGIPNTRKMEIYNKISDMISDLQEDEEDYSFIDIDVDYGTHGSSSFSVENIIEVLKEQIDCNCEKILKLGEFNFVILLKHEHSSNFKDAVRKYSLILNQLSNEQNIKFRIIKTDVKK